MRQIRATFRLLFFAVYTTRIVAEVFWRRIVLRSEMPAVMAVRRRWARRVLYGVGIRATTTGTPPDFPCLVLANHRSYLDPILLLRDVDGFPVSKAEVASWPIIGKGAEWAGILYVKREQSASRATILAAMADVVVQQQIPVILFPEGTTSALPGMLPLKKGAFRTAAKYDLPVVPVAIRYEDPRDYWVDDATFLGHAWERFQEPEIRVHIHFGPTLHHTESETLEIQVRQWIEARLFQIEAHDQEPGADA